MPADLIDSSRGVLFPGRARGLRRVAPDASTSDLVSWFWVVDWDLPTGQISRQHILSHPASNVAVEPTLVGFAGPTTRASHRDLVGSGWAVAALLKPASIPAFTVDPTHDRDAYRGLDEPDLHQAVCRVMPGQWQDAVATLSAWLVQRVGELPEDALLANRMADLIATDASVRSVADVCEALSVPESTVHRLARRHVGLAPYTMIRRRRLQEAADLVRRVPGTPLAQVASDLGYTDQAHLTRDFRTMLGFSPATYRRQAADEDG